MDDASGNAGDIRGWELRITAEVDNGTVDKQVPGKKHKKHTRHGKRSRT